MVNGNFVSLLFLAALVAGHDQGSSVPAGVTERALSRDNTPGQFSYLGSFRNPSRLRSSIQKIVSYYFFSHNVATYITAANDCKAFLGDGATLVYIETQEELAAIKKSLKESDDTGSSYWVGGKYDTGKSAFVWDNGVTVGPWAPWDKGHPNTKTSLTHVYARTVRDLVFRTQFSTVATRYICELKSGDIQEDPEPCYDDNDLVIAVDASGSIGQVQYLVALEFASRLAVAWADNPRNRLSVLVYSSYVQPIFGFGQRLTVSQIRNLVSNAPYLNGGTASDLVLRRTLLEFQQHPRSVPKNLVFLTDGASNSPTATLIAAQQVQSAGIRAFSVGIGHWISGGELLAIAGNNPNHVFNTDGFDDLLKLLQPVSRRVCNK